jgi:hypothetical protein
MFYIGCLSTTLSLSLSNYETMLKNMNISPPPGNSTAAAGAEGEAATGEGPGKEVWKGIVGEGEDGMAAGAGVA